MPANSIPKPSIPSRFANVLLLDGLLVIRFAGLGIRKEPSLRSWIILCPILEQNVNKRRVKRNSIVRVFRLNVGNPAMDSAALNQKGPVSEVQVRPPKRHDLAGTEP
jgi:hypothetical protein